MHIDTTIITRAFGGPASPLIARFSVALLAVVAIGSTQIGCSDTEESSQTAEVTIIDVTPGSGYPGVETKINFALEAGKNTKAEDLTWSVNFGDGKTVTGESADGSATSIYERSGDYEIIVSALVGSKTVGTATRAYRVFQPVDIAVSGISARPNNVRTGEDTTVSFTLENMIAGNVQSAITVNAYLSTKSSVTAADLAELKLLGTTTVQPNEEGVSLTSGEPSDLGMNATVPEVDSGDYYVIVVADPNGQIADTNPSNNIAASATIVRVENVAQMLPDISVENVYALPDRAFPVLNRVMRGFTLANRGPEPIYSVVHKTYISVGSSEKTADSVLIHTSEPMTLGANIVFEVDPTQYVLTNEIVPPTGTELEVYVIVEAYSEDENSEEIRTDNNIGASQKPILVTDQRVDGPDIAVREFSVSPGSTFIGGTLDVSAFVANEGTQAVGSFFCGIYMGDTANMRPENDPRLVNLNIPGLTVGEERNITRTITIPGLYKPGTYFFYIVCDPLGTVAETFRSNNSVLFPNPIKITGDADVDLFVDTLTVPATVPEGDTAELVAKICVTGSNPSGVTRAALYRNTGNTVKYDGEPIKMIDVPNINPGACIEVPIEVEATCSDFEGTYVYGLQVDVTNRLPETNENNNKKAGANKLVVDGKYCKCVEDEFAPNNRANNARLITPGQYEAAVCAAGTYDYFKVNVQAGESLVITTNFLAEKGPLTTTLFNATGTQTLSSDSTAGQQRVARFISPTTSVYTFAIHASKSDARNYYDFNVQVLPRTVKPDVTPYNVRLPARDAFSIGASLNVNVDAYNLGQTPSGEFEAHVYLVNDRSVGNIDDIRLGTAIVASLPAGGTRSLTIPVKIPATGVSAGNYFIAVTLDPLGQIIDEEDTTNNDTFSRAIKIETRCHDAFEPNDSFSEAFPLDAGDYSNLVACADASDYYKVCPGDAKVFTATANFNNDDGDIDMELYDENFKLLQASANAQVNTEQLTVPYVNGNQCYYVRVYMVDLDPKAQNTYSLKIDVKDVDPSLKCDAAFEPNDSFATASSLFSAIGHPVALDRCPVTDVDFYYVNLTAGQKISLRGILDPANQPGALRMQLYSPTQQPINNRETGPGVPIAEFKNYTVPATGRYYLQVTVSGNARRVTYKLELDGATAPAPTGIDLAVSNLVVGPGSYEAGDLVRFEFDLKNLGSNIATAPAYKVYLSTSATLNINTATLLGGSTAANIAGGASLKVSGRANLPATVSSGNAFIHVHFDPAIVNDTNPTNNGTSVGIVLTN